MEDHIRAEFELSVQEYRCLLRALQSRFGVRSIEDVAFLSAEQLAAVTDRWEAAAVKCAFSRSSPRTLAWKSCTGRSALCISWTLRATSDKERKRSR
jgi:hypothetical protein